MKALIIGATGATGKDLVTKLLEDQYFEEVNVFVRKSPNIENPKLKTHIVDFEKPDLWKNFVKGDIVFSCLGTTLKDAGSKDAQWKIDYGYQYYFAKIAKENGVENYVLVSSYGANPKSNIFYSRMKGELEEAIKKLNFRKTTFFQPGMLERKNTGRGAEVFGLKLIKFVNKIGLFKSQKPLPTDILAQAMINISKNRSEGISIIKLDKIFKV